MAPQAEGPGYLLRKNFHALMDNAGVLIAVLKHGAASTLEVVSKIRAAISGVLREAVIATIASLDTEKPASMACFSFLVYSSLPLGCDS